MGMKRVYVLRVVWAFVWESARQDAHHTPRVKMVGALPILLSLGAPIVPPGGAPAKLGVLLAKSPPLQPAALTTPTLLSAASPDASLIARSLGYVVGVGSLLLYTPIGLRVYRQRDASGLTLSTWWLKLISYSCSDVYSFRNNYPVSTYIETLIITVEASIVLGLVAYYQRRLDPAFACIAFFYVAACAWALTAAPPEAIAFGQASATLLNTGALLPQLLQNYQRRSPGGFSPITAGLACAGCAIRLFTTIELTGSDPLLLAGFAAGLALNAILLAQIVYYGSVVDGKPLIKVLAADFADAPDLDKASPLSRSEMERLK